MAISPVLLYASIAVLGLLALGLALYFLRDILRSWWTETVLTQFLAEATPQRSEKIVPLAVRDFKELNAACKGRVDLDVGEGALRLDDCTDTVLTYVYDPPSPTSPLPEVTAISFTSVSVEANDRDPEDSVDLIVNGEPVLTTYNDAGTLTLGADGTQRYGGDLERRVSEKIGSAQIPVTIQFHLKASFPATERHMLIRDIALTVKPGGAPRAAEASE